MNAVDTNVLVYACDNAAGARQERALGVIHTLGDGALLWQVACEFIAATRKFAPDRLSRDEAWQRLSTFVKMMPLVPPSAAMLDRARELHLIRQCSFWDAMIYAACLESGISTIYSEDLPGSQIPGLNVVNPFAA